MKHEMYMKRCIALAKLGAGNVAPNPMVGAVLVHNNKIIGEGYHEKFGGPHAEVNCLANVQEPDRNFIKNSTLYVSLEPCSHFGKTPPCVELIIEHKIQHVVIGCTDSFKKVNGAGVSKLIAANIKVEVGVLEAECIDLNKRFFTFHKFKRPYIILKWAQSSDGFITRQNLAKTKISNTYTDMLVHKWRSHEAAILVGTNTVKIDNPTLTTRNWAGKNPVRIIIDEHLKLTKDSLVFNNDANTIVINSVLNAKKNNVEFYKIREHQSAIEAVLECLYGQQINSVIVEGGSKTLQYFINEGMWNEARVITNVALFLQKGLFAPTLKDFKLLATTNILTDRIDFFLNNNNDPL